MAEQAQLQPQESETQDSQQDVQPEGQVEPQDSQQEGSPSEEPQEEQEASPDVEDSEAQEAQQQPEKHKRTGGYQRKIERLERQNQQLLEMLRGAQPPAPQTPQKELTAEEKAAEQFRAMVRAEAAALFAQERNQTQAQQRQAAFQQRLAEARATKPDFDDVVASVADIPVPQALNEALLTSEQGPEIMYQLARSPAELARLSALPPLEAAREIGRLEARVASGAAPKPKPSVRPPAPPSKVGGAPASSTRDLVDLPISEYKRLRNSGRR